MLVTTRWKVIVIVAICLFGFIYAAPNFLTREQAERIPSWLPHQQINLGLDLQGGSHLLLEVDVDAVIKERLGNLADSIRSTLRAERLAVTGVTVDGLEGVSFRVTDRARFTTEIRDKIQQLDPAAALRVADDGTIAMRLDQRQLADQKRSALAQSIEIIRRRIDEVGTRDPTIQAEGVDRILVQLPGLREPERIKALLGKTAKLNFHLLDTSMSAAEARASGNVPSGSMILPGERAGADGQAPLYLVKRRVIVSGERLTDAQPGTNSQTGEWVVNFRFDSTGGRQFGNATKENVGQPLAIILDNRVISAPVIREPILGGSGQISGSFNVQSANDLAVLLRAGALPAPLNVIEERTVGADLGTDSITAGSVASVIGVLLVIVFMVIAYGLFGVIANLALVCNLALLMAILSVMQATLTLPGIAGIVLTMGMAVDANVLIYERIREEIRNGRSALSSIEVGFDRAIATIVDSNLTTLIAGLLLFMLGSGPVRGFAVVLSIGIITSMFSAITVSRLLVATWYRRNRPQLIPI